MKVQVSLNLSKTIIRKKMRKGGFKFHNTEKEPGVVSSYSVTNAWWIRIGILKIIDAQNLSIIRK